MSLTMSATRARAVHGRRWSVPGVGFDLLELQRRDDLRLQSFPPVEDRAHSGAIDALAPRPFALASDLGDRNAHQLQHVILVQQCGLVLLDYVHVPFSTRSSLSPPQRSIRISFILRTESRATVSHVKMISHISRSDEASSEILPDGDHKALSWRALE